MTTTTAKPVPAARKGGGAQQKLLAFASLIVLLVFFSLASPNFLQTSNILAILQATSVNGVLAVAATLVIITGGIDLSVGSVVALTTMVSAALVEQHHWSIWVIVPLVLAMGSLFGMIWARSSITSVCSRSSSRSAACSSRAACAT